MSTAQATVAEYESGLTSYSILAVLCVAFILLPGYLYLSLTSGGGTVNLYLAILLFTEIGVLFGRPLTRQEVTVIYITSGVAINTFWMGGPMMAYMITSPISKSLGLVFPWWWRPLEGSVVIQTRTLFHPDWIVPLVPGLSVFLLFALIDIVLGSLFGQMYIDVEELDFPMQQVDISGIGALADRQPEVMKVFSWSFVVGLVYAFFLYGLPMVTRSVLGISAIADFTPQVELFLPGAIVGVATDVVPFVAGFVVPFNVIVSQLIGSLALYVIGNPLALKVPLDIFKPWQQIWVPGMSSGFLYQTSYLYLWINLIIGASIGVAIAPIIARPKDIFLAFRDLWSPPKGRRGGGYMTMKKGLPIYLAASAAIVAINNWLVPSFPIWILIALTMGWTFIYTMINARAMATTSYGINIPYLQYGAIYLSGYQGFDAWYMPSMTSTGGTSWVSWFKICKGTRTTSSSLIKAYAIALPLGLILSLLYVNVFWQMAPMQSLAYPWTSVTGNLDISAFALWVSRKITTFSPLFIVSSAGAFAALSLVNQLLHTPFSVIGLLAGFTTSVPYTITTFIGGLVGRYVMPRVLGRELWQRHRYLIPSGIAIGEGVVLAITSVVPMIAKAMIMLPY